MLMVCRLPINKIYTFTFKNNKKKVFLNDIQKCVTLALQSTMHWYTCCLAVLLSPYNSSHGLA